MRTGPRRERGTPIPWPLLSVYLLGVFLGALDTNVLGPVFPLLMARFHVTLSWIAWTVTVYTVAYVASTVMAGGWGDRVGHRHVFILGIAGFGLASLLAALSPTFPVFLLARLIQGASAGAVYPNAQAEGLRQFGDDRKGLALGIFGAAFGVAAIIGPTLGGFLGQFVGWPAVFLINVPLALVVLGLTRRVPASARVPRALPDASGGVAFAAAVAALLLFLTASGPLRWALLLAGLALAGLFVQRQRTSAHPFLDTRPLANPAGIVLVVGAAIVGLDMSAAVFVPTLVQRELHFGVLGSGAALLPAAFAGAVLSGVGGGLTDRMGPRPVLVMGLVAAAVGGVLLALPHLTFGRFLVSMVFLGIGTAFTMGAPLNRMGVALYRSDETAQALSLMAVFRSVGLAAGPVVLTAAAARYHGFAGMFGAVAVLSAAGALLFVASRPHASPIGAPGSEP